MRISIYVKGMDLKCFFFFYLLNYDFSRGPFLMSYFWFLSPAVCAEQPPGGEEHAAAEPSAGLRSATGPSSHADCRPWDRLGEKTENELM